MVSLFTISILIAFLAVLIVIFTISKLLIICKPNELIILSGRKRKLPDGRVVGYRIIRGGRTVRIPLLEKVSWMTLETIPLELTVQNAYSKGGIPLKVEAIANIKIDSTEPALGNAVERFLTKKEDEIYQIAKDTLEGNLRGVLATLTPEEVNEDRLKFAQSLIGEADNDLTQLGLQLDTLKIQNVSDETGYLDSIGRKQTADILTEARKAEADKTAEAEKQEAVAREQAEVAKVKADQAIKEAEIAKEREVNIAKTKAEQDVEIEKKNFEIRLAEKNAETKEMEAKSSERAKIAQVNAQREIDIANAKANQEIEIEQNNLRIKKAELEKEAVIKENESLVEGEKAKVQFQQKMEEERIILQKKKLMADIIEPANAKKEALELEAKGHAAPIIESGNAKLKVLNDMIEAYKSTKGEGEKIFMLNMLPEIVSLITDTVNRISVDKVSIIDTGSGKGISNFANQMPAAVITMIEQISNLTGIDIVEMIKKEKNQDLSSEKIITKKSSKEINES